MRRKTKRLMRDVNETLNRLYIMLNRRDDRSVSVGDAWLAAGGAANMANHVSRADLLSMLHEVGAAATAYGEQHGKKA